MARRTFTEQTCPGLRSTPKLCRAADEPAQFGGSVMVERTKGTLSVRCDKEEFNLLALNLAHDIIEGTKTVPEARDYLARAVMAFKQGEKDPYTQSLRFEPMVANGGDPDTPAGKMPLGTDRPMPDKDRGMKDRDMKKNPK